MSRTLKTGVALLISLGALAAAASFASAEIPIKVFGLVPGTTQAGAHPDVQFAVSMENSLIQQQNSGYESECACENPRFVTVHAPTGLVGNPHATPRCTAADFAVLSCPVNAQIGIVSAGVSLGFFNTELIFPVYNLEPRTKDPGLLGVNALGSKIYYNITGRTGSDYGLDTQVVLFNGFPTYLINNIFWGVPASPEHDSARFQYQTVGTLFNVLCDSGGTLITPNEHELDAPPNGPSHAGYSCLAAFGPPPYEPSNFFGQTPAKSTAQEIPFTENPTTCGVTLETSVDILGYDNSLQSAPATYPAGTGCDALDFNPSLAAKPTTTEADSPSGLDVNLDVPQPQAAKVPSPSEIKSAVMKLPVGFTINSNAADGKVSCEDVEAKIGINSQDEAHCPEFSKIGTLEILTSLLPGPLQGSVYLGAPQPGNRYRIFLTADGFNTHVKLAGSVHPDPVTGQIVVSFNELPQSPFSNFKLHIFGAERGLLATPTQCGTYAVETHFTPWDSVLPDQDATQFFTIDSGPNGTACPQPVRPFHPSFKAGSAGSTAGAFSPLSVEASREDGEQFFSGLSVSTPLGFAADLQGVPYCPQSAIDQLNSANYTGITEMASSSCPASSQIGTVEASAGAGSRPLNVTGKAYLAGPYKGAPLSLEIVLPAVSGPYDLGNVAVRAGVYVNPVTAQVTTISDPFPQFLDGIQLRGKSLRVNIDRPNFAINPTNCEPLSVAAVATGDQGTTAPMSSRFQVANCAALPFRPRLTLTLTGGINRRGHPGIIAVLTRQPGEANIRRTSVALPAGELLDNGHIGTVCTRPQFAANQCPEGSLLGTAEAVTPILDQPLKGNVYLRSSSHNLPDLVADLEGQIDIELAGKIDTIKGGSLRTTFESVPDAPVTQFTLNLAGGKRGLLQNSTSICAKPRYAETRMTGQNGVRVNTRTLLKAKCGSKRTRRAHHRARHRSARVTRSGRAG
jgi:hypothetical protein